MFQSLRATIAILCVTFAGVANAQYYGHEFEGTQAPIREGEQPVIPLDTEDPTYNAWRTPLPSFEGEREGREPGMVLSR